MLKISELPTFTLLTHDAKEELNLAGSGAQIQWLADLITRTFPQEKRLGLNFPTGPKLILTWLAVLKAGKEPCLLHSPTEKISKDYWRESVRHTLGNCGLEGLIHAANLLPYKPEQLTKTLLVPDPLGTTAPTNDLIPESAVIQLSSGTTGHKKGVRLTSTQLRRHVENYNQVMCLGKDDVIVSWLPLYHDMGFIACFVMPLLLKVPVVMIDPMTWVKRPESLLNAIEEYRGTVCYMPNFGFEVMARQQPKTSLATMRHWISCSEPTYFPTLEQFCRKLGVAPATVSTCYAMAENVFAVTQSKGVKTVEHAGEKLVSCGSVIPSTRVKLVDDEIWVKSDTSLESYIGTGDVRDADGFYATGDLGMIVDGEVYVSGRKRDVMISGGRKYFLNDLDFAAGKIMRESAGRIAALAEHNQHLGTETVTLLVERPNFWDTSERKSLIDALRETTDLEAIEVHFVPPTFITKTSSGKINRKKTLEDWHTFQTAKSRQTEPTVSGENQAILLAEKIEQSFASLPRDRPLGTELDSLGAVLMRLICDSQGVEYSPEATVDELLQQTGRKPAELPSDRIYSIVALVDGVKLGFGSDGGFITPQFIAEVSRIVGAPVRVEHIAVPPASILFSDLIFHDYFMPRDPGSKYGPFSAVIQKIKRASLVLIDDEDAFRLREYCAYPRLSHRFNQEANADLLGHRLQSYTLNHHLLPREVVTGRDIDPSQITATIEQMANYLKTPVMKLAFHQQFQGFTKGWDYTQYRQYISDVDYQENPVRFPEIQAAIINFIQSHRENVRYTTGAATEQLVLKDLPHFCSFVFNVKAVDYVLGRYRSFCICGLPSSIPYIEKELRKAGKPFFYSTSLNPERTDYDCMLCTGFHGAAPIAKPYYDFVHIGDQGGRPHNVSHEEEIACPTLAEADQELTDVYRRLTGNAVPIGNYVLNEEESIRRRVQSTLPPKRIAPSPRVALSSHPVAKLGDLAKANELFQKKSPRAAWEITNEAIRLRPHHPAAFLLLAEIARMVGDSSSARSCATHAITLAPALKPPRKFLKGNFQGNTKPEWLLLPPSIVRRAKKIKPTLSVCLIVKNEERFIRQCLNSIKAIADQIVIVDTGSTDNTIAIAREFGAEIHEFKWCDDFSAARNAALQYATGDWVLSFDADEELPEENRRAFLQLLMEESVMGWRLPLFDIGHENEGPNYVPRLFRNAPGLYFIGRVHEQPFSTVEAYRIAWGLENRVGDAALRHHGYTKELIKERDKVARNLLLLEKAVDELPDEPMLNMAYGLELCRSERVEEGIRQYQIAFDTMSQKPPGQVPPETREALLTQYCTYLRIAKRSAEVPRVLGSPFALGSELTASQHFLLGLAHMELEQFAPAAQQMRQCLDKRNTRTFTPINSDILTIVPLHSIAICLWQMKDFKDAEATFQAASTEAPHATRLHVDYATFLHEQGRVPDALQLLHQFTSTNPTAVAAWIAGSKIVLSNPNLLEVALDWTDVACQHHPADETLATARAEALLLAGQVESSLKFWVNLHPESRPASAAAIVLCETALDANTYIPAPAQQLAVNEKFMQWYWRLVDNRAEAIVVRLLERAEALAAILPNASGVLQKMRKDLNTPTTSNLHA